MNASVSLLDPKIYTTQYMAAYSPFLFTVGKPTRLHLRALG